MLSKHTMFTKSAAYFGGLKKRGRLFVISASSGTGKTTLAKKLMKEDRSLVQSVSVTTRPPRPKETQGKDYFFVSEKKFQAMRRNNGFLEWANVFGRFYGTPKKQVEDYLRIGRDVLLLIDVQGAKQVKKTKPDAVFIFLTPPSKEELKRRLIRRGTESPKEIDRRYRVATSELKELNELRLCDYRIVNRELSVAYQVLKAIILAERTATGKK